MRQPVAGGKDVPMTTTSFLPSFDGARLALRCWGPESGPLLVLVHGLGLSTASWGRLPELLPHQRVVAYDLRGHGDSAPAPGGDYSFEAHVRDLEAVLAQAGAQERGALLVGNSLGGGIAVAAAARDDAGRVRGIVLAGSGASGVTAPGLPGRRLPGPLRDAAAAGWLQVLRVLSLVAEHVGGVRPLADRLVRKAAFTATSPDWAVAHVRRHFFATRRAALARTTFASVRHDGVRFASELDVPVLVLHGDRDPEVPGDEVHRLVTSLADAEVVTFPGAGHMLPLTHTEAVAEQVLRWAPVVRAAEPGGQ